ncbi:MAG: CARDB domain-containing protein [Halobacteriota archaeon]|nr:CARDB domain-containing protein [Halobacteriota archaeon]
MRGTYDLTVTAFGEVNEEQYERETFATVWVERYPDLTLDASDIHFSEENPDEGVDLTLNATIHNIGEEDVDNASILFYDGDPVNGTFIGEDVISVTISGYINASVNWTTTSGTHEIYILISPYNAFLEEDYTNNEAYGTISVLNTQPPLTNGLRRRTGRSQDKPELDKSVRS